MTQNTMVFSSDTPAVPLRFPERTLVALVQKCDDGSLDYGHMIVGSVLRTYGDNNFRFLCVHGGWEGSYREGTVRSGRCLVRENAVVAWHGVKSSLLDLDVTYDYNDLFEAVRRAARANGQGQQEQETAVL